MKAALIVGLGSFIGGSLRYLSVIWIERRVNLEFPLAIFIVNAVGSFVIGFLSPGFHRLAEGGDSLVPLFLTVGMMGGFTTFSTFSLQTLKLVQSGNWLLASANAVGSVLCCLASVFVGIKLGEMIFR